MNKGRRGVIIVTGAVAAAIFGLAVLANNGAIGMADNQPQLTWEWRAGRALAQRAAVQLGTIKKEGGGLFGLRKSPSLGGALPDAMVVESRVLAVNRSGVAVVGTPLRFRIPKVELGSHKTGDIVVVGIIGQAAVCIDSAPAGAQPEQAADWIDSVGC